MSRQQALCYLSLAIELSADGRVSEVPTLALLDVATTFYQLQEMNNANRALDLANRSVYAEVGAL